MRFFFGTIMMESVVVVWSRSRQSVSSGGGVMVAVVVVAKRLGLTERFWAGPGKFAHAGDAGDAGSDGGSRAGAADSGGRWSGGRAGDSRTLGWWDQRAPAESAAMDVIEHFGPLRQLRTRGVTQELTPPSFSGVHASPSPHRLHRTST